MVLKKLFRWYFIQKLIGWFVFPKAGLVFAANQNYLDYSLNNGAKKEKCVIARFGNIIDPIHFSDPLKRHVDKNKFQFVGRRFGVYVGRLSEIKLPKDLLFVALKIKKHADLSDVLIVIIGDGEIRKDMEKMTKEMDLEKSGSKIMAKWLFKSEPDVYSFEQLQAKGKAVESVVQLNGVPGEVEVVSAKHPEIKSFADVSGKSLGVTGLGSSTNFLTQYLATKSGVKLGDFTSVAVGAGDTLIKAMQTDQIQAAMTTEPTISRLLKTGEASVLVDMRTAEGTKAALGGVYPASALYMSTEYVNGHKETVQKLANAFVKTLRWINTHSAAEIADKMPKEFYVGDKEGYTKALEGGKGMYTADGVMPEGGPETVLAVLSGFSKNIKGKTIDLSKTYTTEFVKNVK